MKSMNRTVVVGVESVGQVNASSPLYRVTIPVINVFTGTSTHSLEGGGVFLPSEQHRYIHNWKLYRDITKNLSVQDKTLNIAQGYQPFFDKSWNL